MKSKHLRVPLLKHIAAATLVALSLLSPRCQATNVHSTAETASVVSVSDGDTVVVRIANTRERIRLIGIDTPESHPNRRAKKIAARDNKDILSIIEQGKAAAEFTQKLLPRGTPVRVEYDTEKRDHYGRLLAYLWLPSGEMANEKIISSGYAFPLTVPPNVRYQERFHKGFQDARRFKRGLWGR